jgi:hypothetical protein
VASIASVARYAIAASRRPFNHSRSSATSCSPIIRSVICEVLLKKATPSGRRRSEITVTMSPGSASAAATSER